MIDAYLGIHGGAHIAIASPALDILVRRVKLNAPTIVSADGVGQDGIAWQLSRLLVRTHEGAEASLGCGMADAFDWSAVDGAAETHFIIICEGETHE